MNSSVAPRFSAIKFSPPPVDPLRHLPRNRVVALLQQAEDRGRRIFFLQAQAGQGKSSLASQYLATTAIPFAWYQLGPEDQDPVFFFSTLLTALCAAEPGFNSPLLEQMLEKGEVAAVDGCRVAEMLMADFSRAMATRFCLVFDDLHLLENAPASLAFIESLLSLAPAGLRIMLLSRMPFPELVAGKPVALLVDEDLALTRAEISELFNRLLKIPLSAEMGDLLYRRTEGWIMGLVLFGQILAREVPGEARRRLEVIESLQRERMADYFRQEILNELPKEQQETLYKLSLIEEIPIALAVRLGSGSSVPLLLEQLVRRNLFVRLLGDGTTFSLHHLFRDVLRGLAHEQLSATVRQKALAQAAAWYLAEGGKEEALRYFAGARDFASLEGVLQDVGLSLLAMHRVATLRSVLLDIPPAEVERHPWVAYFRGMIEMETSPPQALVYLETARAGFLGIADRVGELLAISQQTLFHLMIDGRFGQVAILLQRADRLYGEMAEELDMMSRIQVAHILAMGHYFLYCDRDKVERYSSQAWQLAWENRFDNLLAAVAITRGYQCAVLGNWASFRNMAEQAYSLLRSPRVNNINRMFLRLMQINLLSLEGDTANFSRQRRLVEQTFEQDLLSKTLVGPLFWTLDIDMAIIENRLDDALHFAMLGLGSGYAAVNSHLRSQYLQYYAFLLAHEGRGGEALRQADESLRLRGEAGGVLFSAINQMILGATCALAGNPQRAEILLTQAISACETIDEKFTRVGAHVFRGLLRVGQGRTGEGQDDLEWALKTMKAGGLENFYLATPKLYEDFLRTAVTLGVEPDYARKLAARKLGLVIPESGRPFPLLSVASLGSLVIRYGLKAEVREEGWSPAQREFWAHLLTAPGYRLGQEQIQVALWPDSPSEKSRANFDTLLSRLRRVLDAVCYPQKAKHYLCMQRKVLYLENCQLDAGRFAESIRAGLRFYRQKNFWQAGNKLYPALHLWHGGYLNGLPVDNEQLAGRRLELERLYLEGSLAWGTILAGEEALEEALEVINGALMQDPVNHALIKALYDLHIRSGDSVKADAVVVQYRKALGREGYAADEVAEIVDSLWKYNP